MDSTSPAIINKPASIRNGETPTTPSLKPSGVPSTSSTPIAPGKKMFLVKGDKVFKIATISRNVSFKPAGTPVNLVKVTNVVGVPTIPVLSPMKEIKPEPIDEEEREETATASANITEERPLTLDDILRPPSSQSRSTTPPETKRNNGTPESEFVMTNCADFRGPSTSSITPTTSSKRNRKPTRRDDYVYNSNDEYDAREEDKVEEPSKKKQRVAETNGKCNCEFILPAVERQLGYLMQKMANVERLTNTLIMRSDQRDAEERERHEELMRLKRLIELQRQVAPPYRFF